MVSKGEEFPESMGGCSSVVWFIDGVQLRRFPYGLPNVPSLSVLPWKKSSLVFSRARMKAIAQSLCSVLKDNPVQNPVRVLAYIFSCSPLLCFGIQAPSWRPWREQVRTPCECGSQKGERFFAPLGLYYFGFRMDQVPIQKNQPTCQASADFGWSYTS